ncbi:hypothetical protein HanPI659440_Chr04g0159851 [Helianthus annuus]|nr:hypothetical protein HanPI659440_Chr04g0159851 [Helianthus annuus]
MKLYNFKCGYHLKFGHIYSFCPLRMLTFRHIKKQNKNDMTKRYVKPHDFFFYF